MTHVIAQDDAEALNRQEIRPSGAHHLTILRPGKRIQEEGDRAADRDGARNSGQNLIVPGDNDPHQQRYTEWEKQVGL
jgi:hypothetical protein